MDVEDVDWRAKPQCVTRRMIEAGVRHLRGSGRLEFESDMADPLLVEELLAKALFADPQALCDELDRLGYRPTGWVEPVRLK